MNFREYLNNIPQDKTEEEWMVSAAALVGTLAHNPEIEMAHDVRVSVMVLFARMPDSLEVRAREHIEKKIQGFIEKTPEFKEGMEDIDGLIEAVEKGEEAP